MDVSVFSSIVTFTVVAFTPPLVVVFYSPNRFICRGSGSVVREAVVVVVCRAAE